MVTMFVKLDPLVSLKQRIRFLSHVLAFISLIYISSKVPSHDSNPGRVNG